MREALKCGICFETLERPYALSPCGHVACYKCLLQWFTTTPEDSTDLAFLGFDRPTGNYGLPVALRPSISYVNHAKVCPLCRTAVKDRPLEMFAIRNAVEGLGEEHSSSSQPAPSLAPTPTLDASVRIGSRNVERGSPDASDSARSLANDPWNNVFHPALLRHANRHSIPLPAVPPQYYHPYGQDAPVLVQASSPQRTQRLETEAGHPTFNPPNDVHHHPHRRPDSVSVTIQDPRPQSNSTWAPSRMQLPSLSTRYGRRPAFLQDGAGHPVPWLPEDPNLFGLRGTDGRYMCVDCLVFPIEHGRCISCDREYPSWRSYRGVAGGATLTGFPSTVPDLCLVEPSQGFGERVPENEEQEGENEQQGRREELEEEDAGWPQALLKREFPRGPLARPGRPLSFEGGLGLIAHRRPAPTEDTTTGTATPVFDGVANAWNNTVLSGVSDKRVSENRSHHGPTFSCEHSQAAPAVNAHREDSSSGWKRSSSTGGVTDELDRTDHNIHGPAGDQKCHTPTGTEDIHANCLASMEAQDSDQCPKTETDPSPLQYTTESSSPRSSLPSNSIESGSESASATDSGYGSAPAISNAGNLRTLRSGRTYGTLASSRTLRSGRTYDTLTPRTRTTRQARTVREEDGDSRRARRGNATREMGTTRQSKREDANGRTKRKSRSTRGTRLQRERVIEARRSRESPRKPDREMERERENDSDSEADAAEVTMVCEEGLGAESC